MIHETLPVIIADLNSFLKRATSDTENKAILSNIAGQSGALAFTGEGLVICTVIGIEKETSVRGQISPSAGRISLNRPVYLNLKLLFSAYCPHNYEEALKFISLVLSFFQSKPFFTAENTPGLPDGVNKISLELYHLEEQARFELWQAIGAKMMPSICMKLRMIEIKQEETLGETPTVRGVG